jgi:hypothetical protein
MLYERFVVHGSVCQDAAVALYPNLRFQLRCDRRIAIRVGVRELWTTEMLCSCMSNGDTYCMDLLIRGTVTKSTNAITGLHLCLSHHRIMDPHSECECQPHSTGLKNPTYRDYHFKSRLSYHKYVCNMDRAGGEINQEQEYQQEPKINAASKEANKVSTQRLANYQLAAQGNNTRQSTGPATSQRSAEAQLEQGQERTVNK